MADLTKEQKKELLRKWRADQNKKYLLSKTNVRKLFRYLNKELEQEPCDHTMRRTEAWLDAHCPPEKEGRHSRRDARNGRILRLRGAVKLL